MREDGAVESVWDQGSVVQSSVSITSSLEVILLNVLRLYNRIHY